MIHKFYSTTQTIYTHKLFCITFNLKKYELYKLMKQNPFSINNSTFYHHPITDIEEIRKHAPQMTKGRTIGTKKSWSTTPITRNNPKKEREASQPENPFYYETYGQWTAKKSSTTNRIVSSTFNI